ncbi:MAG TPA: protein kinase [Vicinamibacterales bacterium]|nr:protein kinase [Vicinamibacterales bacterium]
MIATTIGPYRIVGKLGEGGMGEVYRARDSLLNRDVAIKVLPPLFAVDAERLARFTREAQTLAALNHPNIAQIYGLEGAAGPGTTRALVMELVEGDDLSTLIARGPMPLADVLPIARQIADALEAAHEQGIVHRDLKPANVKVRRDGTVKVLDFGLAKAFDAKAESGADAMQSPTFTARNTQLGMIIGTAAYMAPEQARGKAVDRRADIWAFGVVVFEMLTGRRAFDGDDISDVLASVLKSDPDWSRIPAETPASIRRLLRRCLEKEPRKRLSAIGDARLELDDIDAGPPAASSPAAPGRPSIVSRAWPIVAAVVLTAAVGAIAWVSTRSTPDLPLARLSVVAPPGASLYPDSTGVAISPDGKLLAFIVGNVSRSESQLWVRSLDSLSSRRLEGGDGATLPFWSPDSTRIGFFTNAKLKTIAASGGRAEVLADTPGPRGGTWNASGIIVFAPDAVGPLMKISASGGTPAPATSLDTARKEIGHRFPTFLPDGRHFIYAALPGKEGRFDILAGSLDDDSHTLVGSMDSAPVYAEPGWLLYARQGVLAAQRFDARTLKISGEAQLLPDEPISILDPATSFTAGKSTTVSNTGTLAYFSVPSTNTVASWYDALGRYAGDVTLPPGHYETATISPDGKYAIAVRSTSPAESALWLVDLERNSASPLTSGRGRNDQPLWSPDGKRIVFATDRDGPQDLFIKTIADASPEQPLYRSELPFKGPLSWTPDGSSIVMTQLEPITSQNIFLMPATGKGELKLLVRGPTRDSGAAVSPDGHWLAFISDESGRFELYLQAFPDPAGRLKVSKQGALLAWWTRDGRQLLYVADDLHSLWRVDVDTSRGLKIGTPIRIATFPPNIVSVDATPDRQRFLAIAPERSGPGSWTVVQNWLAALGAKR